jgi:hypothetical protein
VFHRCVFNVKNSEFTMSESTRNNVHLTPLQGILSTVPLGEKTVYIKHMEVIRHYLVINVTPGKVYSAVSTQEGIEAWWCKHTTAKAEPGFMNMKKMQKRFCKRHSPGANRNPVTVVKNGSNKGRDVLSLVYFAGNA